MTEPSTEPQNPATIPRPVPEHARVEREWPGTPDVGLPWTDMPDSTRLISGAQGSPSQNEKNPAQPSNDSRASR